MNSGNDLRIAYAEYNQEASRIFFGLFNEFRNEADDLERDGDENVFQLLRAKYTAVLKQRLERSANLLIAGCNAAEAQGRLRISVTEKIKYFLKEFTRKSELM
jgi:hypothetical protein